MDDDEIIARLRDIESIEQLKARYFRLVDARQWDEWRELFVDDLDVELAGFTPTGYSCTADAFVANARRRLDPVTTIHHGHMPDVTLTGPDTAVGAWGMCDLFLSHEGQAIRSGVGYYNESYLRVDGSWRIASWRLQRRECRHDGRLGHEEN